MVAVVKLALPSTVTLDAGARVQQFLAVDNQELSEPPNCKFCPVYTIVQLSGAKIVDGGEEVIGPATSIPSSGRTPPLGTDGGGRV